MKNKLLFFLYFFLFSSLSIAQDKDKPESAYIKITTADETITYEFDSVKDFDENLDKILNEISITNSANKKEKNPLLTIEISFTLISENISSTITGKVSALSSSIITVIKKLRTQLIAIALG